MIWTWWTKSGTWQNPSLCTWDKRKPSIETLAQWRRSSPATKIYRALANGNGAGAVSGRGQKVLRHGVIPLWMTRWKCCSMSGVLTEKTMFLFDLLLSVPLTRESLRSHRKDFHKLTPLSKGRDDFLSSTPNHRNHWRTYSHESFSASRGFNL